MLFTDRFLIKKLIQVVPVVIALVGVAVASHAVPIKPVSYDMPNGYGKATAGGMYNYWDANYTGSGTKITDGEKIADGAPLSGGLGKLTDGVIATESWLWTDLSGTDHTQQNDYGTGPYVGWTLSDPTISFHFANAVDIDNITLYVDNPADDIFGNPRGGVAAPKSITINSISYATGFDSSQYDDYEGNGPVTINIDNLGLVSIQKVDMTITRDTYGTAVINGRPDTPIRFWLFVSEITFSVPEPSTFILFGIGMAGIAILRNRRRK